MAMVTKLRLQHKWRDANAQAGAGCCCMQRASPMFDSCTCVQYAVRTESNEEETGQIPSMWGFQNDNPNCKPSTSTYYTHTYIRLPSCLASLCFAYPYCQPYLAYHMLQHTCYAPTSCGIASSTLHVFFGPAVRLPFASCLKLACLIHLCSCFVQCAGQKGCVYCSI